MASQPEGSLLFAPAVYPSARVEIRAYAIAAFRVAQNNDQLSLIAMPKRMIHFLVKVRAIGYWKEKRWLTEQSDGYRLTTDGLVVCQSALADQLPTHNTAATNVEFSVHQFRTNTSLSRSERFKGAEACKT